MSAAIFYSLFSVVAASEHAQQPSEMRVFDERTFIYEQPSLESPVIRRLFVGEVLQVVEDVQAEAESRWVKVSLGSERVGFVPAAWLGRSATVPTTRWRPPIVVRDERPLGIGVRVGGETLGTALHLRFQAFSRLGVCLKVGSVLDNWRMRGTSLGGGVNTFLVLWNMAPMIEAGFVRSTYHKGLSTLALTNFYLTAGVEWMFDWGGFVNIHGTYLRSAAVEVVFEYADAKRGGLMPEKYGALDLRNEASFQSVRPGATLGYAY